MANAFPIYLGLVPESDKQFVLVNLVDNIINENDGHLTTGVLGSKYMIDALTQNGREDIAYLLATQKGYPSWSDMVEKYTTMCEFWTLKQSHNHVMTGSIDAFFYKTLAGINFNEDYTGCKSVAIKPFIPEDLDYVKASIETINGRLNSSWIKQNGELKLKIKIPFNVKAEVYIPESQFSKIYENNVLAGESIGVKQIQSNSEYCVFLVESGEYEFIIKK